MQAASSASAQSASAHPEDAPPRLILVVEDDDAQAMLCAIALKDLHPACIVDRVRDGCEAMDYVRHEGEYAASTQNRPDVVVLDLKLPRMNGHEVLREMKADP